MLNDVLNRSNGKATAVRQKAKTFKGLLRYTGCNSTADIYFYSKFKGFVPLFVFDFIENQRCGEAFGFEETPIKFIVREKMKM